MNSYGNSHDMGFKQDLSALMLFNCGVYDIAVYEDACISFPMHIGGDNDSEGEPSVSVMEAWLKKSHIIMMWLFLPSYNFSAYTIHVSFK